MKMKRQLMVLMLTGALTGFGLGCQRSDDRPVEAAAEPADNEKALTQTDKDFLNHAEEDHLKEQTIARLAKTKSTNNDVKDYAEMLDADHTSGLDDTLDLMRKYNMPDRTDLDTVRRNATEKLDNLSGAAFDREFVTMMVGDHELAIDAFKVESATQNEDVRDYVNDMLPKLQKHMDHAMELQGKLNGVKKTTAR